MKHVNCIVKMLMLRYIVFIQAITKIIHTPLSILAKRKGEQFPATFILAEIAFSCFRFALLSSRPSFGWTGSFGKENCATRSCPNFSNKDACDDHPFLLVSHAGFLYDSLFYYALM